MSAIVVPLHTYAENAIDKRFYRRKYDAQKVLEQFAASARDETDLDALAGRLVAVVQETMQPEGVSLWLRQPKDASSGPSRSTP